MEAGGRGRWAFLVPGKEKADSISRAQGLEKLLWVEIDLISGNVTYKGIKRKIPRVRRRRRLFRIPSPEPEEPENPRVRRRLLFPSPEPQEQPSPHAITRPWSKPPLRFVKHLLHRLQIPDYIHFSSVCHAWHISKKRAQTPPAPQHPWFLLPRQTHESVVTFYSPSEKRNYRFSLPSISGYDCVTSSRGGSSSSMVAMTNKVYIVKENLDLVGYDPQTNDVTNLVLDVPQGTLPRPSMENDHFLTCILTNKVVQSTHSTRPGENLPWPVYSQPTQYISTLPESKAPFGSSVSR
ncbi:hypothetical protein QJS10_CPA09g01695 [Acorus calamus]|uniref:F-box domain-containing protein n=1 Tax=Acorus calamus TaxID=4465 RepID=A0AAV9E2Z4_ACOCL|nr:hypothetical protein QJS10_CPA09g01695 [Acorus calamus]